MKMLQRCSVLILSLLLFSTTGTAADKATVKKHVTIAVISSSNSGVRSWVRTILGAEGIAAHIKGSVFFSVRVEEDVAIKAQTLLKNSPALTSKGIHYTRIEE
jgi:hypothetical protein